MNMKLMPIWEMSAKDTAAGPKSKILVMAVNQEHRLLRQSLVRLMAVIIMLGFSTSAAFADGLAETATNPVGNLIQLQMQDAYNWSNYESDGYSNAAIIQPVIPVKLPWEAVPLMISRTTVSALCRHP